MSAKRPSSWRGRFEAGNSCLATLPPKALGPDHPDVAQSLENYAALLRETGRSAEAKEMEARAKAIRAKHAEENPAN